MLTEPQVEHLLAQLQRLAERAPTELRPKRRQLVRGMRSVFHALLDDPQPGQVRRALVAELVNKPAEPLRPPKPRQPVHVPEDATALQRQIVELFGAGHTAVHVAKALGCAPGYVYSVWAQFLGDGE